MARPNKKITVTEADRRELERILRAMTSKQSLVQRTSIILLCADGKSAEEITDELDITPKTFYKWRGRYEKYGLSGLKDAPRPGQPRKMTPEKAQEILSLTVEKIPEEATHWSIRLMAKYADVTPWQVQQVWKASDLKPHRLKTFKISRDPRFAEKVVDVVGLYLNPPENALVLSVDEKTQIQALNRTQPMLPLKPGKTECRTHDYQRNGTASLYAALNLATGEVMGTVTQQHRAKEFLAFLKEIHRNTPKHLDLHLILDNSSTHKTKEVKEWLEKHSRFHLHFTPTSASWLNAVEGWFAQLEQRALYRGVFTNVKELRHELYRYIEVHNRECAKPFRWTKTAEAILASVEKVKQSIGYEN